MTSQIFISYSKKDKDFAWKMADDLVSAGHKVWIDRSLQVGEDWEQTIIKKLEEADEVIVILSSNAISSKWVQHEGSIAFGLKKKMYPVLIESLPGEDLPLWVSRFQYHSFVNVDYAPAFNELNAILTPPNPIQDLLNQQVKVYQQTGGLIGEAILRVVDEARETLVINDEAKELIEKSRTAIEERQQELLMAFLAYDATIEGWARALDLRDHEIVGHTQRVTEMTLRLTTTMGINESELVHIRRGAILHDIGKMGIPDSILHKPGPLTKEEWVIMREHPQLAYNMLSPIEYLRPALAIPYNHHEHWDGTGYPRGLKGEQIPPAARIFAVVDVYVALMSDRVYRAAWPYERVLAYIRDQSGKHFDPEIAKAFLDMISK